MSKIRTPNGLARVVILLEEDNTYTIKHCRGDCDYYTVATKIETPKIAQLVKKAFIDGIYTGIDEATKLPKDNEES